MLKLTLCLTLGITSATARAEGGLLGSGARYTKVVGTQGAVQNRASADHLYRQAMRDERESRRTHDSGLHHKAVREANQARQADGQGRAFARAALQALVTTMLAGQVKQTEAKDVDVEQLRRIAYAPNDLERELAALLDEQDVADNDTGEGGFAEETEAEKPTALALEKPEIKETKSREPASAVNPPVGAAPSAPWVAETRAPGTGNVLAATAAEPRRMMTASLETGGAAGATRAERTDQIERERQVFLKKLGVGQVPPAQVRAEQKADIFQVIHARYQILRADNNFMEFLEGPAR